MASELWSSDAGAGPAILLVHGGGTHGPLWASDLAPLTTTHRVITATRRGYPGSPPSPRDWSAHTEDMVAVLDDAGVERATVAGHSAGCIVALDLARRHPERVERLVLLDPAVRVRSFLTPSFGVAFAKAQLVRRLRDEETAIAGWFRFVYSYRSGGSAWDRMTAARREALRANAGGVFADFGTGDGSDVAGDEQLASLSVPVTVVIAAEAPETLRRSGEHLAATIPGAQRVVLEAAGHALAFDQPEALLERLRG